MTRRIVIVALAALLATAAGALARVPADPVTPATSKPPPRLSRAAIAAAEPGCRRYREAVRPHLYGAGADDLREQIRAFRAARASEATSSGPMERIDYARHAGVLATDRVRVTERATPAS
jgi:hypothetical protein